MMYPILNLRGGVLLYYHDTGKLQDGDRGKRHESTRLPFSKVQS